MRRDLEARLDVQNSLAPAARTASANGTGIDLQGFDGALVEFIVGTITDGTHTPKIQDSDDNSTFNDAASGDQVGAAFAALASNTNQKVAYIGNKRYIRAVSTVSGATTGGVYAAVVQRGLPARGPL